MIIPIDFNWKPGNNDWFVLNDGSMMVNDGLMMLWWFGTWGLFFHVLGMIIPIDFQTGWNHQPAKMTWWRSLGTSTWFGPGHPNATISEPNQGKTGAPLMPMINILCCTMRYVAFIVWYDFPLRCSFPGGPQRTIYQYNWRSTSDLLVLKRVVPPQSIFLMGCIHCSS